VVEFLLKTYGKEKMAELVAVFKEGAAYDDALMKVYGFDQDGLDAQWRESLGLPSRGAIQATPEATVVPAVEKPRGELCFGMVPGLALLALLTALPWRKV